MLLWHGIPIPTSRAGATLTLSLPVPEQIKTLLRILIWSLIFLIDLTAGIVLAARFGLYQFDNYSNQAFFLLCSTNGPFMTAQATVVSQRNETAKVAGRWTDNYNRFSDGSELELYVTSTLD